MVIMEQQTQPENLPISSLQTIRSQWENLFKKFTVIILIKHHTWNDNEQEGDRPPFVKVQKTTLPNDPNTLKQIQLVGNHNLKLETYERPAENTGGGSPFKMH